MTDLPTVESATSDAAKATPPVTAAALSPILRASRFGLGDPGHALHSWPAHREHRPGALRSPQRRSGPSRIRLADLPLPVVGSRIGPVLLLFETATMYMVKPVESVEFFGPKSVQPAVGIDKRFIGALITVPKGQAEKKDA